MARPGTNCLLSNIQMEFSGEDSVAAIIAKIENWVISSLQELHIPAKRDDRMQGVWVGEHKICSISLSFLRWTSRHGFTINVTFTRQSRKLVWLWTRCRHNNLIGKTRLPYDKRSNHLKSNQFNPTIN